MDKIVCPKCLSKDIYRYGREKHSGLQKYQCKHCKTQFVPNRPLRPKSKTNNYSNCPICGSKLHLRKRNKNSIQLRCSKRPNCRYTTSIPIKPFPKDVSLDVKIPKFFRYPFHIITYAFNLYFHFKLSSREISQKIYLKYSLSPSHTSIIQWCKILSSLISSLYKNITTPPKKITKWLIDETVIKINGHKVFLFLAVLDFDSRFPSRFTHLSYKRP